MRELAGALGIGCGSIYNHIESKEALLLEFIEELYGALYLNAMRTRHSGSAPERLRAIVRMHLTLHDSMAQHFLLAEREWPSLGEAGQCQATEQRLRYEQVLMACLQPTLPRAACARSIVSLLNQAPAWLPFGQGGAGEGWRTAQAMVQALLASVEAHQGGYPALRVVNT